MKLKNFFLVLCVLTTSTAFSKPLNGLIYGTKLFSGDKSNQANYNITFNKEQALNHKLLLTAAGITVLPSPTGQAMASKVVFFERRGSSLYLFEVLDGKLTTTSLDTKKFLSEFPIVSEDENSLTVDFKKGMSTIFYKSGMGGSQKDTPIKVTNSFIDKVEHRGDYLFIDQFIHYEIPGSAESGDWRVKFTFSSYKKNENFKPRESSKLRKVGYFHSYPQLDPSAEEKEKSAILNILRFDPKKQITYYISSNVPAEWKEAVRDGILYWNRAFGREYLKVEDLPKDISVHEPGYNIVQWVDWKTAGFAYADIQSDPLTGEILQSTVYMTSSFAIGGVKRAKNLLKKMLAKFPQDAPAETAIALKGFHSAKKCQLHMEHAMAQDAHTILSELEDKTEEESKVIVHRYVADYIREVVAHEVGHTLGLRHNFAGSTHTNITHDKWDELTKMYFLSGIIPEGIYPSSSVMDYTPSFSSAIQGGLIRLGRDALAYDKKAIEWGYSDDLDWEDMDIPLFCTDDHNRLGIFQDCKTWDYMVNPIIGHHKYWEDAPSVLAYSLFLTLEEELKENPGKSIKKILRKVKASPKGNAKWMASNLDLIVKAASPNATFFSIFDKYFYIGDLENEEYKAEVKKVQEESFATWGSVSEIIFKDLIPTEEKKVPLVEKIKDEFNKYLTRLDLPEEKMAEVKTFYKKYFQYFEKELLLNVAKFGQKWALNIKDKSLVPLMTKFSDRVLFAKTEEVMATSTVGNKIYKPYFHYKSGADDLRQQIIGFANTSFYPTTPSYKRTKKKITSILIDKYVAEKDRVIARRKLEDLDDGVFDWYMLEAARFLPIMPKVLKMSSMMDMQEI
jgi:hypothetical protein